MTACVTSRKEYVYIQPTSFDVDLPKELYLEKRLSGCDSAIAYMDHFVTPGVLSTAVLPELDVKPFVAFENLHGIISHNQSQSPYFRFYIAPECFVNLEAQKIYDIFVLPKYHQRLKEVEREAGKHGYNIGINTIGSFGFQILEGKVVSAVYFPTLKD